MQLNLLNDYNLLYFNKHITKKDYNAFKHYHYITYIYMDNDFKYDNNVDYISVIIQSLNLTGIYSIYVSYNKEHKYFKIEYYTD